MERIFCRQRKKEPEMLSEDMRMDMLGKKWEQQEMEFIVKDSVHYTDVGQDFDKDEEKRNQEQSTLEENT